jgi:hypothetical protein
MAGTRLRKVLLIGGIGVAVAAIVKALRGDPAPQFANHPSVDGGHRPAAPVDPVATADDPLDAPAPDLVEAVLQPVADVAANELPGHGQPELPLEPEPEPASEAAVEGEVKPIPPAPPISADPGSESWVFPVDGACPDGYPVKAKLKSGVFHVPGGAMYERTHADRCYPSEEAAEADGLRAAKR